MRVAIVIEDKEAEIIGECLSSAHSFFMYDTLIDSILILDPPNAKGIENKALVYSQFLSDHHIEMIAALDFGPKAISFLTEKRIAIFQANNNDPIETQFKLMIKHIKK